MKLTADGTGAAPRPFRAALAAAIAHFIMTGPATQAHPDTWHTIELLTERIATGDQRAALYYARATEYRSVEKWQEAEADLRHCLDQDPGFFQARLDLGPVLLAAGRPGDALEAAREAARSADHQPDRYRAAAWAGLARIERASQNWSEVLAATDQALRWAPRGEVDWYLLREEAFRGLGRLAEAIADLEQGEMVLHSSRIRLAWIDALIDLGRSAEALPLIDRAMAETPFQAPVLIRRGAPAPASAERPRPRPTGKPRLPQPMPGSSQRNPTQACSSSKGSPLSSSAAAPKRKQPSYPHVRCFQTARSSAHWSEH